MGLPLPLIGVLLLVAGGGGCTLLLLPRRNAVDPLELAGLSVVLGSGLVAALTFLMGFVVSGYVLLLGVGFGCLAAAGLGKRFGACLRVDRPSFQRWWLPTIILGAELSALIWLGGLYVLGWDSLVAWEFKARAATLNAGSMPLAYYLDLGTRWSHPEYPLLLPLAEAWLFDWAGQADEGLVRGLFGLFDAALLAAIYVLGTRLTGSRWNGILAMLLVLLVPQLIISNGGATTGWADYVIAVCYLMAAGYLVLALEHDTPELFGLVGVLCAALVWTKQEGVLLWACVALATAAFARANRGRAIAQVTLPALLVVVGWRVFLQTLGVPGSSDYLPVNLATFWAHLDRVPELLGWLVGQMGDVAAWGILWPALMLSAILPPRGKMPQQLLLALLVVAPLVPDIAIFVFSAWTPYTSHVASALPRLMEQVAPLAVLTVACAAPQPQLPSRFATAWGLQRKGG